MKIEFVKIKEFILVMICEVFHKKGLRACSWGLEFIFHTDIPVKMGKINAFDREFSPLAPSVRALELNSVFISNGCLALHDKLTVSRFLLF